MVIQLTTNYWLVLPYALFFFMLYVLFTFSIYISCHFHLCSFEHLFSCHFYFAHLSFSFPFLIYLIININPKKYLMVLGLFGYYACHYGAWDFSWIRIRDLGLSWRLCDFIWLFCLEFLRFTSRYWVVCLFCVQVFVITSFVCNLEFTRIQSLLCSIFVKT